MPALKKHALLSALARAALFDPPSDATAMVRHYTLSPEDLALIRQRRRSPNRLGFAVHLAYLRFPGRALGPAETPPAELVAFIAQQLGLAPGVFDDYARRAETHREHQGELQAYLDLRPFRREDLRPVARVAFDEATGTDRGVLIVAAMAACLRARGILLPTAVTLERLGLAARAKARRRAYRYLAEGLDEATLGRLNALIMIPKDGAHPVGLAAGGLGSPHPEESGGPGRTAAGRQGFGHWRRSRAADSSGALRRHRAGSGPAQRAASDPVRRTPPASHPGGVGP